MLEYLLVATEAFCTWDFFQLHVVSMDDGSVNFVHKFFSEKETLKREEDNVSSLSI